MNVKRFTARTSREAFALVRQAFGEDAVVLSTKPCPEGMEVLAMAQDSVEHFEKVSSPNSRGDLATRAERQTAERPLAGRRLAERLQQTAPAMEWGKVAPPPSKPAPAKDWTKAAEPPTPSPAGESD